MFPLFLVAMKKKTKLKPNEKRVQILYLIMEKCFVVVETQNVDLLGSEVVVLATSARE